MSSSAINQSVFQAKVSGIQNDADSSAVYSAGVWSFKNSTAVPGVTITNAGNVGIGNTAPLAKLTVGNAQTYPDSNTIAQFSGSTEFCFNNAQAYRVQAEVDSSSFYLSSNTYYSGGWQVFDNTKAPSQIQMVALNNNSFIAFHTSATNSGSGIERMRIDASGNLLIARTSASITTGTGVIIDGGTAAGSMTALLNDSGPANTYHVFNTTAGVYRFYVSRAGQINATSTSIVAISDLSLKENIRDLETGLSQVLALKPRRFDWKEETQIDQKDVAGFIAQEVEEVLPELVYEYKYNETETKKSLKMGDMLPTLVKAIQELSAKVDAQAAEIEALKAKP